MIRLRFNYDKGKLLTELVNLIWEGMKLYVIKYTEEIPGILKEPTVG